MPYTHENTSNAIEDKNKIRSRTDFHCVPQHKTSVPYTTKLAEHTQAFLGKPGSTEPQLAIRVKWYHEAHFRFN
jgi:hypothetical protein